MYNIHSHYENIFHYLSTIVTYRRLLYLLPYGATQPENLERIADDIGHTDKDVVDGPMFICYDQEPILGEYNFKLLDYVRDNCQGPFILVTTEKNSDPLELIQQRYGWPVVYYFHHVFAAHDWFRGIEYDSRLVNPATRKLKKKYITFNRLTSNRRVYRSLFISELIERNILDQGHVSYGDVCPDNQKNYAENLLSAVDERLISKEVADKAISNINKIQLPLRIDFKDQHLIPNNSFALSAVAESQESFVYVVTETCYWERKCHLTEKIFKPIVSRMPFILVGPAHNLEYLRSYGFQTFDYWWDESYDTIEDPVARMQAVGEVLERICTLSEKDLEFTLQEMQGVLDYNYNLFYSQNFIDRCWNELVLGLRDVCEQKPTVPGLQEATAQYLESQP